jgi:hypothetical protein
MNMVSTQGLSPWQLRLLTGGCIYICLWLVTAFVGGPQIQRMASGEQRVPQSSTDISSIVRVGRGIVERKVRLPYHWCVTRAYAPFLVVAHSGVVRGGFNADGNSAVYLWFFGYSVKIRDLECWTS